MQVIAAMRAGITAVAPSFNMEFGEARFLASEVSVADAVLAEQPGGFAFGDVSRSDAFAEFDDILDDAFATQNIDDSLPEEAGFGSIKSLADILRRAARANQRQAVNG
jgi:hypothetical protein